jgi:hypothetical protein
MEARITGLHKGVEINWKGIFISFLCASASLRENFQPFVIFWPSLVSFTIHPSAAI